MNDADDLAIALAQENIRRVRLEREVAALREALAKQGGTVTVLDPETTDQTSEKA